MDPITFSSRPIKLDNFSNHYRAMANPNADYQFAKEFEELHLAGRHLKNSVGQLPCNQPKNRYSFVVPFDHTRVKLQTIGDDECSDYINANYVAGFNSPQEYIATQGPLPSTTNDFWRMIWETDSKAIVMLTGCVESGVLKCHQYWPSDNEPTEYGDIYVRVLSEDEQPDWTISKLALRKGSETRIVYHLYFTTWPDFGVPASPRHALDFVRLLRELVPPGQMPIVVHCSAGVGRSGTFIAVDHLLQRMRTSDRIDVYATVLNMRKERCRMVQNVNQYIFVHQCLLTALTDEAGQSKSEL